MYVRVGCGCMWRVLYEALKARGLRSRYYGPMSGFSATIEGALSQGSFFLGSTEYGTVRNRPSEAYAWDPDFGKVMSAASVSIGQDLQFLCGAIRNGAGLIDGSSVGLRIALAGKKVFKVGTHIIQIMIDDHSAAGAAERLKRVRKIALVHGASELAPLL